MWAQDSASVKLMKIGHNLAKVTVQHIATVVNNTFEKHADIKVWTYYVVACISVSYFTHKALRTQYFTCFRGG